MEEEFKYVRAYGGEELIKELKRIPEASYRLVNVVITEVMDGEYWYEAFLQVRW